MKRTQTIFTYLNGTFSRHLIFWVLVFLFSVSASSFHFSGIQEVLETYGIRLLFQFIIAYLVVFVFVPKILSKNKKWLFFLSMIGLMLFMHFCCVLVRTNYLEVAYPATYMNYLKRFPDVSLWGRFIYFPEFFNTSIYLLFPTCLLLVFTFYKDQQRLLKLNEQKKVAELAALKNQLNPHFLFNTLNNLYALAYKKSEHTTTVIQKLSDILDYILYRCNDTFVPLHKEIELVENYIALEKIRYGDRIQISLEKQLVSDVNVAPLVLLTFIENAFKHGVSDELKLAKITIRVEQTENSVFFKVENTKPLKTSEKTAFKKAIGLQNVIKQLELLYPDTYNLKTSDDATRFSVDLKLQVR